MQPGKRSAAELLKEQSQYLRDGIAADLAADSPSFTKPAAGILKFHGVYQQDDRDLRKLQKDKAYSCMVRVSIPGGRLQPDQYLQLDRLAGEVGDSTLRITSRQGLQYHYVGKRNLKGLIQAISAVGLNTWAACGDVVRNVTCAPAPVERAGRQELQELAQRVSREFKPKTRAYVEIWLDGERAASIEEEEELYGVTYLPRKFKIAFTQEGENTIDIYSDDLGFVAHYDGAGKLTGYTVLAGGGMGQSNGVKLSHPRMADAVCSIGPSDEEVLEVARAVVSIHRDFGNRGERKLARLKYVLDERGLDWFRQELEGRVGRKLEDPRPLHWERQMDFLGWHPQGANQWFFGLRVISGRLKDGVRAAVRNVVENLQPEIRLTAQQNLTFCGLSEAHKPVLEAILRRHGVPTPEELPPILRYSMACPALPTCGQAITESERILPDLVSQIQSELDAVGLSGQALHLRTTGCPNGCARPYTAEIGIVGFSVGLYSIYLGGSPLATRLAPLFAHNVKQAEIASLLRPVFANYAETRQEGEAFGDWAHRQGVEALRERFLPVPAGRVP